MGSSPYGSLHVCELSIEEQRVSVFSLIKISFSIFQLPIVRIILTFSVSCVVFQTEVKPGTFFRCMVKN